MAKPDEREDAELSVTVVGDLASALQLASAQRRSCGENNSDVTGLVEEAVSDWLDREIHGPMPAENGNGFEDPEVEEHPIIEFAVVGDPSGEPSEDSNAEVETRHAVAPETPPSHAVSVATSDQKTGRSAARSRAFISGRALIVIVLIATLLGVVSWSVARKKAAPIDEVTAVPPGVGIETGVLIIDAQPWAKVERVWNHTGVEVPLPEDRLTPLRLEVPPGGYNVTLVRPGSKGAETCAVPVTALETIRCMPQNADLEVQSLFKQTGWYQ